MLILRWTVYIFWMWDFTSKLVFSYQKKKKKIQIQKNFLPWPLDDDEWLYLSYTRRSPPGRKFLSQSENMVCYSCHKNCSTRYSFINIENPDLGCYLWKGEMWILSREKMGFQISVRGRILSMSSWPVDGICNPYLVEKSFLMSLGFWM